MTIVSGNGQTAEVGTSLAAPLVVRVADSLGAPARGVVVRYSSNSTSVQDSSTTDAQGMASAQWTLGSLAVSQEIVASAAVYASSLNGLVSAVFAAQATPGPTTKVALLGGDGAVAAPGSSVDTVTVAATDRFGNATPLVPVDWLVRVGGGTVRPFAARTDAQGNAGAIWVMGPAEGPNALDVTVGAVTRALTATASVVFPATAVAVGETHSCALANSGAAYCWGANSSGQLGVRRLDDVVSTTPQRVAGALSFVSLVAGANHTCGLTTDGAAYCWGNGRSGQIGVGGSGLNAAPARVPGVFAMLAAGARHTCGLTTAHTIYCWGDNTLGQLGEGADRPIGPSGSKDFPVPVLVTGATLFTAIAAASTSTCVLASNGGTYCWGSNAMRELGGDLSGRCTVIGTQSRYDGTTPVPCSAAPVRLELPTLAWLAASKSGWCGVTVTTALFCWGNAFERPRLVEGARVTAAWVVDADVCGQEAGDSVACWGVWGRTGFPIVRPFGDQVRLGGLANGLLHSCGIAKDGKGAVYCWGNNASGQLGDGTTGSRPLPMAVLAPRSS